MHHYISKSVKCPFYAQESDIVIYHGEGVSKGNCVHLSFRGKERLAQHKEIYCRQMEGFPHCPIYQMLAAKYEGDNG